MTTAQRNRAIKNYLTKELHVPKVSVTGGNGTSYGWVGVAIFKSKPANCTCTPGSLYCTACRSEINDERKIEHQIESRFRDDLDYFPDDMGSGEQPKLIVDTRFI